MATSSSGPERPGSWGRKKRLLYSVLFSLLSISFWTFIYFNSRHNENFAYYGTLDGIPLGLVLRIFNALQVHKSVTFTILCAQAASLLFWNFVAFIFSIRLKWVAWAAIVLDVAPGAIILQQNSVFHGSSVPVQEQVAPYVLEINRALRDPLIAYTAVPAPGPAVSRIQPSDLPA